MLIRKMVLLFCLLCLSVGLVQAVEQNHPLLIELGIDVSGEQGPLYLVRSAKPVVASKDYRILGTRRDLTVLAGNTEVIEGLRLAGCFVVEMGEATLAPTKTTSPYMQPPKTAIFDIHTLVNEMSWSLLEEKINWLVAFETRYSYSPECTSAANGLLQFFTDLELDTSRQSFNYSGQLMYNVVATQTGITAPDSVIVICGHYDSTSQSPYILAPGADDNGTGTSIVMTCAEILSKYSFKYTIKYVCFAGEEQGLQGSKVYAQNAANEGEIILAALNFDMLGYGDEGVEIDLEIETNSGSLWVANIITAAADLYTDASYELHIDNNAYWGDFKSFWNSGYDAVNHEESWDWGDPDFNPFYHSIWDSIGHIDPEFMENNGKVAVASLATLAVLDRYTAVPDPLAAPQLEAQPNPFNGTVRILMAGANISGATELDIFDLRGRLVNTLPFVLADGNGQVDWHGIDSLGRPVESGVYLCKLRSDESVPALRLVHVK